MTDLPSLTQSPIEVIQKRSRFVVMAGWTDVPHLTEEMMRQEKANLPPHEFEARSTGKPSLGKGAIYPVPESEFICDPFEIAEWMPQCYALDVGWVRTAALWGAHDPQTDIWYLYSEHYRGQAEPAIHAQAIRARGSWIPGLLDPAARGRNIKDGTRLTTTYHELGLTLSAPNNALEAGILEVWQRLSTGRLKVFKTLVNWLAEYRFYQRDDNGAVKEKQADHLMDDTRYLVLSGLSIATVRPAHLWRTGRGQQLHTSHYDPMSVE